MVIQELWLKNFGKFHNKKIAVGTGIQLFYGQNESGKSTIHMFIKSMFFGLDRQRGRASVKDSYRIYEPWENPGFFAGVMRFTSGGKVFRLERNFASGQKQASLVCETDGEELSVEHGDLDMLLDGLEEAGYRNTVSIDQNGAGTDQAFAAQVQNFVANFESTGTMELDIELALASLAKEKKRQELKKKEALQARIDRCREIEYQIQYAERERARLITELNEMPQAAVEKAAVKAPQEPQKERSGIPSLVFLALFLVQLAAGMMLSRPLLAAAAFVWLILAGISFFYRPSVKIEDSKEPAAGEEQQKQSWKREQLEEAIREKEIQLLNLKEKVWEYEGDKKQEEIFAQEVRAIDIAIEEIRYVAKQMQTGAGAWINQLASEILREITDGRYTDIRLDEQMQIRINTKDRLLGIHQVSRGTSEQIYFSIRMAIRKVFGRDETFPVILDEAFTMYDEHRAAAVLDWLSRNVDQVLIFTSQEREENLLRNAGIPYQRIEW